MKFGLGKFSVSASGAVLAMLMSQQALALGLGEARVESFLHQPLDVRMRVLEATDAELDSLTVRIASASDYDRLGLMSSALALNLQVSIDRSVSPPVVRIVSTRGVDDPVVQLLVDARWASGRMLREYTLFLDPPSIEMQPPARPEPTPPARAAEPVSAPPAAAPTRPGPASTPAAPRAVSSPTVGDVYGPVASGETLWTIASRARPSSDISMNQMMLAIVDLNPQAFRDGNINRLLRGAELRIPDESRIRGLDANAAAALVAEQNRAFRQGRTGELQRVSDAGRREVEDDRMPPARPEPRAEPAPVSEQSARLSLVPPDENEGGSGLSDSAAEMEELRQRLARAEEELYAARAEAEEFRSRVDELEQAVNRGPGNGLGLQDADLARLEQTLREARQALESEDDPQQRREISNRIDQLLADAAGRQEPDIAAADATSGPADDPADDPAGSAPAEPEAAAPAPQPQVSGGLFSALGNPLVLIGLVLVLLAALLGGTYLLLRRRRSQAEAQRPALRRAANLPKARRTPAQDSPQQRLERNPADLAAHLALLREIERDNDSETFAAALEEMFEHVDSGEEPEWESALKMAQRVIPGHALVKGSADAVDGPVASAAAPSGQGDADDESERDAAALDDDEQVDDLISRLDEDADDEMELDWPDEQAPGPEDDAKPPLLREDRDPRSSRSPTVAPEVDDDLGFDMGDLESEQDREDQRDGQRGIAAGEAGDEEGEDETRAAPTTGDESVGSGADQELMLDWPDEEEAGEGQAQLPDSSSESSEAEEDIFAASEDDTEVKLDLARAYLSWSSSESARTLLEEVKREGNEEQRAEARRLLDDLPGDQES